MPQTLRSLQKQYHDYGKWHMGPRGSRLIGPLESLEGPYCCHGQSQADPSICGMPSLRLRLGPSGEGGGVNVAVGGCVSSTELRRLLCLLQVVVPSTHRQGKGEVLVRCGKCHRCADDGVLDGSACCCNCSCLSNTPSISGRWGSWKQPLSLNLLLRHHTISRLPLTCIACMSAHRLLRVQLPPEMLEPTAQLPGPAAHVTQPPLAPASRPGQLQYPPQVRSSCHRWPTVNG